MWRLLRAELAGRLRDFCITAGFLLLGLAALLVVSGSDALVFRWGVSGLVGVPLLVNFTCGIAAANQHRAYRHATLPVTRRHIALIYLIVPILIQVLGALLAVALVFGQRWLGRGTTAWEYPVTLAGFFLLVSQWLILQRELLVRCGDRRFWALVTGLVSIVIIALPIIVAFVAVRAISDRLVMPWVASVSVVGPAVLLGVAAILLFINLHLFLRRDVVAG